jgi:hypothetical protein
VSLDLAFVLDAPELSFTVGLYTTRTYMHGARVVGGARPSGPPWLDVAAGHAFTARSDSEAVRVVVSRKVAAPLETADASTGHGNGAPDDADVLEHAVKVAVGRALAPTPSRVPTLSHGRAVPRVRHRAVGSTWATVAPATIAPAKPGTLAAGMPVAWKGCGSRGDMRGARHARVRGWAMATWHILGALRAPRHGTQSAVGTRRTDHQTGVYESVNRAHGEACFRLRREAFAMGFLGHT